MCFSWLKTDKEKSIIITGIKHLGKLLFEVKILFIALVFIVVILTGNNKGVFALKSYNTNIESGRMKKR